MLRVTDKEIQDVKANLKKVGPVAAVKVNRVKLLPAQLVHAKKNLAHVEAAPVEKTGIVVGKVVATQAPKKKSLFARIIAAIVNFFKTIFSAIKNFFSSLFAKKPETRFVLVGGVKDLTPSNAQLKAEHKASIVAKKKFVLVGEGEATLVPVEQLKAEHKARVAAKRASTAAILEATTATSTVTAPVVVTTTTTAAATPVQQVAAPQGYMQQASAFFSRLFGMQVAAPQAANRVTLSN